MKNRPEAFTEMNDYVDVFSQKINLLDKISHRVYKEEKGGLERIAKQSYKADHGPRVNCWFVPK